MRTQKAQLMRIRNELKLLYIQKHKINKDLYHLHLHNTNTWNTWWSHKEHKINKKLQLEMRKTSEKQNKKLETLENANTQVTHTKDNIQYPTVLNQSNMHFTDDKIQLLGKGMKYNLHQKLKHSTETLCYRSWNSNKSVRSTKTK
jgi:hypothetical protein